MSVPSNWDKIFISSSFQTEHHSLEWECNYGHIWDATLNSILHNNWCPICNAELTFSKTFLSVLRALDSLILDFKKDYSEEFLIRELLDTDFKSLLDVKFQKLKKQNPNYTYEHINKDLELKEIYTKLNDKKRLLTSLDQLALQNEKTKEIC